MSTFGDILDELIRDCETALPGITTERGFVPLSQIGDYPFLYAFMDVVTTDPLPYLQEQRQFSAVLRLITNGETQEELYTRIDAIRTQLYANPYRRLQNGLLDSYYIQSVALMEQNDPGGVKGASITVLCVRDD